MNAPPSSAHGSAPDPHGPVFDLIRRAREHPLGLPYLLRGAPDSVAATFQVHAFLVDAARERLLDAAPRE